MIYNLEFYFQSNNKCECWTRHFQTCQFSKQWIPYGSLCRFLEEMLQQNEEVKKRERERATGAWEKREGDTEKKEKNYHEKVKKKLCRKLRVHAIQTGKRGINNLGGMSAGLKH